MTTRTFVLGVLVVLVVGGGASIAYLASTLDARVKNGIEASGSEALGLPVRVDAVELSLLSGRGVLRGLRVANPSGYSDADALRLGEVRLQIDLSTLLGDVLVVEELAIEQPRVNVEVDAAGLSNIEQIGKLAGQRSARAASPDVAAGPEAGAELDAQPARRLIVQKLSVGALQLSADLTPIGGSKWNSELPALEREGLGGAEGAPGGEIGTIVMRVLGERVFAEVARKMMAP
jgi:hypothetical protein